MSLPIWGPIDFPPDFRLMDINSLASPLREEMQGKALEIWIEETGEDIGQAPREWTDDEGMFVICDEDDNIVGVTFIVEAEDA